MSLAPVGNCLAAAAVVVRDIAVAAAVAGGTPSLAAGTIAVAAPLDTGRSHILEGRKRCRTDSGCTCCMRLG